MSYVSNLHALHLIIFLIKMTCKPTCNPDHKGNNSQQLVSIIWISLAFVTFAQPQQRRAHIGPLWSSAMAILACGGTWCVWKLMILHYGLKDLDPNWSCSPWSWTNTPIQWMIMFSMMMFQKSNPLNDYAQHDNVQIKQSRMSCF